MDFLLLKPAAGLGAGAGSTMAPDAAVMLCRREGGFPVLARLSVRGAMLDFTCVHPASYPTAREHIIVRST
jgi:hypothetical protein